MKKISGMNGEDMALFCAYCGAGIVRKGTGKRTWNRRRVVHINICQEPSIKYFCNRDCKLNWIFKRPDLELEKDTKGN